MRGRSGTGGSKDWKTMNGHSAKAWRGGKGRVPLVLSCGGAFVYVDLARFMEVKVIDQYFNVQHSIFDHGVLTAVLNWFPSLFLINIQSTLVQSTQTELNSNTFGLQQRFSDA